MVGDVEAVRSALDKGLVPVDADDDNGASALCMAAKAAQAKVVMVLVQAKADVWRETRAGNNALHFAAQEGSLDVCKILTGFVKGKTFLGGPDFFS